LGEAGFGQYAAVVAFVGIFGVFFELGLSQYVQRAIAQDPSRTPMLFWNLVLLRLALAVSGVVIITVLSLALRHEPLMTLGVLLFTATFVCSAVLVPLTTVLTANERFDLTSTFQVIGQILTIILSMVFLWLGADFLGLIYAAFVVMPTQVVLSFWAVRHYQHGSLRFQISPATWPALIRASLPFGLTSLALVFNYNVDTVILDHFYDKSVVGWYSVAYRLIFSLVAISRGFLDAITPTLAREHSDNPERVHVWVRKSLQWMLLFGLPAAMGVSLLAPQLVRLLYGQSFDPSIPVLEVISWDIPLMLICAFCGNVTAAVGLERPAARIYLMSSGINVALNLMLIPRYGMMAAAVVTVATDGLTLFQFGHLLNRHGYLQQMASRIFRIVVATSLMGGAIWLARALPLPLVITGGALSYVVLALLFRLIHVAELAALSRYLVRR
jgi:O-antigen/teichoic acid export membrane protein